MLIREILVIHKKMLFIVALTSIYSLKAMNNDNAKSMEDIPSIIALFGLSMAEKDKQEFLVNFKAVIDTKTNILNSEHSLSAKKCAKIKIIQESENKLYNKILKSDSPFGFFMVLPDIVNGITSYMRPLRNYSDSGLIRRSFVEQLYFNLGHLAVLKETTKPIRKILKASNE